MKQAHNLTAGTITPETFYWSALFRPVRISFKSFKGKILEHLPRLQALFITALMVLLIGGLFVSGSYLFFVQLAKYGW